MQRVNLSRLILSLAVITASVSCNSDGTTAPRKESEQSLTLITTLLISAPSSIAAARQSQVPTASEESYTYVSASPGSSPGVTASIANRTRNQQAGTINRVEVSVKDGGFDPVPIAASAGDTLQVEFLSADRSVLLAGATVVPKVRPPKIVRTNPRPGKKDVPLNARFEIVFSEPVDPGTITPDNIRVTAGATVLAGTLVRTNDYTVEFVPADPLRPETLYQMVIRTGVRNLGGVALETEFTSSFETGTAPSETPVPEPVPPEAPVPFQCRAGTQCLAFTWQGEVFTAASNVLPAARLLADASRPEWSPDGSLIAFTRPDRLTLAKWQMCISQHDGTGVRCIVSSNAGVVVGGPSWSPDGTHVAFSVFEHSCPNGQCGQLGGNFSSVKLLDTRTMQVTSVGSHQVQVLAWSPDGRIAYAAWGAGPWGRGALHVMNADGSDNRFIGHALGSYSVSGIAWSPDGARLGLALRDESACPWYCDTALGIVNAEGGALQVVASAKTAFQDPEAIDSYIDFPAWSPDGSVLTYTHWGWCYDIDPGCPSEIRAWNVDTSVNYLLVPKATYGSWRR